MSKGDWVKWLSELDKNSVPLVGGKAANLAEMYKLGLPVPQAFVITAEAYKNFLTLNSLDKEIYGILKQIAVENTHELNKAAEQIQKIVANSKFSKEMETEILEAYELLDVNKNIFSDSAADALGILKNAVEPVFVAVRSSATAEDSVKASFAGQQETFLNVKGKFKVLDAIKKCFASLFSARSIYYRVKKGFEHESVYLAVVVQKMVNSDKSGVIFSQDPVSQTDNVVIESVFGLGEGIVSGKIKPDHLVVSRNYEILDRIISEKKIALVRDSGGYTETIKLTPDKSLTAVLTDYETRKLAEYALKLEAHYAMPQDIEFAIDSGDIYIVQTRPITTLAKRQEKKESKGNEVLSGQAASPGIASGSVKIIRKIEDLQKIRKGDVLVTEMTNPDMVVAMQRAAAIVTNEGGATSHASIISREMGIPCVVGTRNATSILSEGMHITVNGFTGKVYEGEAESLEADIKPIVKTKTEIKVIVDFPDVAKRASQTESKSVGLLRIEGIIASHGRHPLSFKGKDVKVYEDIIYSGLSKIAKYFDSLWIRTSDIRSDEFKHLSGTPGNVEANPMLGFHGIRASLKNTEILEAEIRAASRVAEKGKEVGIMIPQVISVQEIKEVKVILQKMKIDNLTLGVMVETPAVVQIMSELCEEGISFASFGTNDLTQYTLAIDRNNENVQYLYDEMHPAVLRQIKSVIEICKKYGVKTSICGQAGSKKEMAGFLVVNGIDSISVNADAAHDVSVFVKELEEKMAKEVEKEKKPEEIGKVEENESFSEEVKKPDGSLIKEEVEVSEVKAEETDNEIKSESFS